MKFSAWIMFQRTVALLVYLPIAHWVWANGFLAKLGVLDFAGGTVVHINAYCALVGALVMGKRKDPSLLRTKLVSVVYRSRPAMVRMVRVQCRISSCSERLAAAAFIIQILPPRRALAWMVTEWLIRRSRPVPGLASVQLPYLWRLRRQGILSTFLAQLSSASCWCGPVLHDCRCKQKLKYDDTLNAFGIHGIVYL